MPLTECRDVQIGYDLKLTPLSIVVAITGTAVAAMHFAGMAAIHGSGTRVSCRFPAERIVAPAAVGCRAGPIRR